MIANPIDSKNFDANLLKLLKTKRGKNAAIGRFDIENIPLAKKVNFIVSFLQSLKYIKSITYKILFWEKEATMRELFKSKLNNKKCDIITSYRNGKSPGILYIDNKELEEPLLKVLLNNHFNYEMAEEPALNLRIQICINQKELILVLDIYDDRGFNIYYLPT